MPFKENFVYTVTKIFGVDAVKTRVFSNRESAEADIAETIEVCADEATSFKKEETENEVYYILNTEEKDPKNYIEFVLRRCEIKNEV